MSLGLNLYSLIESLVVDIQIFVDELSGSHDDHLVPEAFHSMSILVFTKLLLATHYLILEAILSSQCHTPFPLQLLQFVLQFFPLSVKK